MDEDAVRDMVAELRATLRVTRAELSDALNVLAQIEQAVGGRHGAFASDQGGIPRRSR